MGDEHGHDHDHHDHGHEPEQGSFATGQEEAPDTEDKEHVGDFAEGQATEEHGHEHHAHDHDHD